MLAADLVLSVVLAGSLLAGGLALVLTVRTGVVDVTRRMRNRCRGCGYDLRGGGTPCPECGGSFN